MRQAKVWAVMLSFVMGISLNPLQSFPKQAVFENNYNAYFIETGSYDGEGIQMAIEAGFPYIYSIELSAFHYEHCKRRFASFPMVHLVQGDSSKELDKVLNDIDAPATFWLDGHYSSGNTARGQTNTPIFGELAAIGNHYIKTHTILIDDVRLFGTAEFDFIELDEIIEMILQINPRYQITFADGYCSKDILVAQVKEF